MKKLALILMLGLLAGLPAFADDAPKAGASKEAPVPK